MSVLDHVSGYSWNMVATEGDHPCLSQNSKGASVVEPIAFDSLLTVTGTPERHRDTRVLAP